MREIGGYIELDTYTGKMLHENAVKLNCGRNALAYVLKARQIKKLWMPKFMCDSCDKVLADYGVDVHFYSVDMNFRPQIDACQDWIYVVNFYGQLSNEYLASLGKKVIVDNAQAYFRQPVSGVDTLYTCRKFFGVPDGALLYTDQRIEVTEQDESFSRMRFLLGRYERTAGEFYAEYVENNRIFNTESIKRMSRLTDNLLHGLDYEAIQARRTQNFSCLHELLSDSNQLSLVVPEGAFMYPYYVENGAKLRKKLQEEKIFIPTLWPAVLNRCNEGEIEYQMAMNILPIPVDQRYTAREMTQIVDKIKKYM